MNLGQLVEKAKNKNFFNTVDDYANFGRAYLEFIQDGLQAVIVSKNENNYRFFQYKSDGGFNFTRPINANLMLSFSEFDASYNNFKYSLNHIREIKYDQENRRNINRIVYTCQQAIGASLDALPSGRSNEARKINGDLFERYIRIILREIGINVRDGVVNIPVELNGEKLFTMKYQHDIIVEGDGTTIAIGSVKTSSKDRLDKMFVDKFLYNRLTGLDIPHFAVFLNDVQRKGTEPSYDVAATFKTGHFKGYTIKLNPLDGVYYCDARPIMLSDNILKDYIHTFDNLLVEDIWKFIE